jgi:hypothetical protein
MLPCMRTTLSLDPDVVALLQRVRREQKSKLRTIVNEALRKGLTLMTSPVHRGIEQRTEGIDLGRCLIENLDDVAEALARSEGDH